MSKKRESTARFRIDDIVKKEISDGYINGESLESLAQKYQIPHVEYVRRIVKNLERSKC